MSFNRSSSDITWPVSGSVSWVLTPFKVMRFPFTSNNPFFISTDLKPILVEETSIVFPFASLVSICKL